MPDQPDHDDQDELFRAAMAGVEPLEDRRRVPARRPAQPKRRAVAKPEIRLQVAGNVGHADGVNQRQLADLAAGRPAPQAILDLHGLRRDPARHAIERDVERARRAGHRCLLIVHGKGRHSGGVAVLRELSIEVLSRGPVARHVLAFCPALPRDGGDGALYVLIRKRRARVGP